LAERAEGEECEGVVAEFLEGVLLDLPEPALGDGEFAGELGGCHLGGGFGEAGGAEGEAAEGWVLVGAGYPGIRDGFRERVVVVRGWGGDGHGEMIFAEVLRGSGGV
jgi:hypothetical protein